MQKVTHKKPVQGEAIQGENSQGENKKLLSQLRDNIDVLDEEILHLLQKRAGVSKAVAKAKNGSVSFRPEREKEVLERLYSINNKLQGDSLDAPNTGNTDKTPNTKSAGRLENIQAVALTKEHIKNIWAEIFSCSRSLQRPLCVSFLGPLGTFSHFASREVFGQSSDFIPCVDFSEVFERVYKHESNFGLVPIENSQQGSVGQCLDLFDTYPVKIIGEHFANICQCLLSTETDLNEIIEIFSHPQALMQSNDWIRKNLPNARLTEMSSTAHAAHRAMHEEKTAVIGHEKLAQLSYENLPNTSSTIKTAPLKTTPLLHVLAKDIAKDKNNKTRFAIIAPQESIQENMQAEFTKKYKKPKSSFTFSLPDKAGALSDILCLLEKASINLTKLESRPLYQRIKNDTWKYRFFADANTNLWQESELVKKIHKLCHDFRVLGVYESNI